MRSRKLSLGAAVIAAVLVVLGLSSPSLAQGGQGRRDPNQWDQRYWNTMRKTDVEKVIARLERNANDFRRDLDRWLDNSRIDGTRREDEYNNRVRAFEQATNRLRAEFDRRDKWWETRDQVKDVLEKALPVAEMMRQGGRRYSRELTDQWWTLRRQLNKLATTYRLPQIS